MARQARGRGESGTYHVMLRGINQTQLFYDDDDKQAFLQRVIRLRSAGSFRLYAYALMGNHVHLLLGEQSDALSVAIKRLAVSYSHWFNNKYDRSGYLFQGRFKSEPVDDDSYLLTVVRYIHLNPVKVGQAITSWTSYNDYMFDSDHIDTEFVLAMFSPDDRIARTRFADFHEANSPSTPPAVTDDESTRVTDDRAITLIKQLGRVEVCTQVAELDKATRNDIIHQLKGTGLTIRQISRLTGINRGIIQRVRDPSN